MEDMNSIFTCELLHSSHLGMSRLFETCPTHYMSLAEIYSSPRVCLESRKRLSAVRLLLLKVCVGTPARTEKE